MKNWNLSGGAAKLELAFKSLKKAAGDAQEFWHDDASRRFQEKYLAALEPQVRDALDAIHRLEQILSGAEHECGSA
jgi:uncharacterized protein YukE